MNRPDGVGRWASFFLTILFVGMIALWAIIPVEYMESIQHQEQIQIITDEKSGAWIDSHVANVLTNVADAAAKKIYSIGDSKFELWLKTRIYISIIWIKIITYRAYTLIMWLIIGFPFIVASTIDSYYIREARKTTFISQSPILHKFGINLLYIIFFIVSIWMIFPLSMPIIIAPVVVLCIAISLWLLIINLQKRL
jgi:hypothetical protein